MKNSTIVTSVLVSTFLAAAAIITGCEHGTYSNAYYDKGNSSDDTNTTSTVSNDFVGGWKLTGDDSSVWYLYVYSDSTCRLCDTATESSPHLTGTYTVSGSNLKGALKNPGVGDAEIIATLSSGTMSLDFIEHWHDPYKHIAYTGTKL